MTKIVTYNIMHGLHVDLICKNISRLIEKGCDVICLQEVEFEFEKPLGELLQTPSLKDWHVEYAHLGPGGNLAVLWNDSQVKLKKVETIALPTLSRPTIIQRLRHRTETRRRGGLICTFVINNREVEITNVHLAWEGGMRHRLDQLKFLNKFLNMYSANYSIIAGDFNIVPAFLRPTEEKKIKTVLGPEWINSFPDIRWTFDIANYLAPQDGLESYTRLCRALGITFRSRLDYFFSKNLEAISGETIDLPGSDHRPVIGMFRV
jgi:exonuclease III